MFNDKYRDYFVYDIKDGNLNQYLLRRLNEPERYVPLFHIAMSLIDPVTPSFKDITTRRVLGYIGSKNAIRWSWRIEIVNGELTIGCTTFGLAETQEILLAATAAAGL